MSARKSSHRTIFLIVSSGSPLALIASSLRSTSKKPVCPMTRSLHPPMAHCRQRVRFAATWREEFFEVPYIEIGKPSSASLGAMGDRLCKGLTEAAARMGHEVVEVYADNGISGSKGRNGRPAFDRLHRDAARRKFDVVMAWSVD